MSTASLAEFVRPWKLGSLAAGTSLLIAGSFSPGAPDWDIPISLIMAGLAYLTAPWSMRVLLDRRWRLWPAMLFLTWFTVDGCYWLYWHFMNPAALEAMRSANFPASLALYGICGVIWLYRGSLRCLLFEVRKALAQGSHAMTTNHRVTRSASRPNRVAPAPIPPSIRVRTRPVRKSGAHDGIRYRPSGGTSSVSSGNAGKHDAEERPCVRAAT